MSTGSLVQEAAPPVDTRLAALKRAVIVPAYNEEGSVARVIEEIRAFDPGFEIVVVDDGSTDKTSLVARAAGARVLRLPFNVGIGGAVQTGHQYARDHGFDLAIQVDGDGQHDASELPKLLAPIVDDEADLVVGTRFIGDSGYTPPKSRRLGILILAWIVSLITHQKVTDPTSGFRAVNRRALELFAGDYPHDYPEVEATVLDPPPPPAHGRGARADARAHGGQLLDHDALLARLHGQGAVALFVGLFRRYPKEEA